MSLCFHLTSSQSTQFSVYSFNSHQYSVDHQTYITHSLIFVLYIQLLTRPLSGYSKSTMIFNMPNIELILHFKAL